MSITTNKGFIKDQQGNILLPFTRGELVLDSKGYIALNSEEFLAKDGHPGLITAAERAMLSNTGNGQNLTDIYNKLQYINSGLKVGTSSVSFYRVEEAADGTTTTIATPITFTQAADAPIAVNAASVKDTNDKVTGHTISLGLNTITVSNDDDTNRIKDITVDAYGRVTEIKHGAIANEELPAIISGKTLNTCTAATPTTDDQIANKAYVDAQVNGATAIATGALVFKGIISKQADLENSILIASNVNGYYKVVPNANDKKETLKIDKELDYQGIEREARLGDTLIVREVDSKFKFVYIPSGDDDVVATFSVQSASDTGTAAPILTNATGAIDLKFVSDALSVTKASASNSVTVTLPKASAQNNGYLSKTDWQTFTDYATNLAVDYTQIIVSNADGAYKIGEIKIGTNNAIDIYGVNNVSTLGFDTTVTTVPTLKFTETGKDDVTIGFAGGNGISTIIDSDNNNIVISQNSAVKAGSASYLEITDATNGAKEFGVKLGGNKKLTEGSDQLTYVNGLADTDYVLSAIGQYTHSFEIISYSLKTAATGDPTDPYRYGNEKLRKAIGGSSVTGDATTWNALVI